MKRNDSGKRSDVHVNFVCSSEEYAVMRSLCAKSTSLSFSEYARKTLLEKPVAITYRNLSLDALIAELNEVRNQLDRLVTQHPTLVDDIQIANILHAITTISNKIILQCIPK
jgi:hypothetical protein